MVDRLLIVGVCILMAVGCSGKRGCCPMENEPLSVNHDTVVVSDVVPVVGTINSGKVDSKKTSDSDQRSPYNRFMAKTGSCVSHTASKTIWRKS